MDIRYELPDPNNLCFDILKAYISVLFPYLFAGGHDHSLWPLTTCQSGHKTFDDTFLTKKYSIPSYFCVFQPVPTSKCQFIWVNIYKKLLCGHGHKSGHKWYTWPLPNTWTPWTISLLMENTLNRVKTGS